MLMNKNIGPIEHMSGVTTFSLDDDGWKWKTIDYRRRNWLIEAIKKMEGDQRMVDLLTKQLGETIMHGGAYINEIYNNSK